ncbi:bifunctional phosphopantothenoylcysteine decarboxylase/phosphopantothenate--cysteine ligase CoaBC [Leucobacter denitrificans]|uniref:Coenzyme A biosynthesis bifunctional protein CoaBC n=1 Tax=Leucobacter denitrificans TaxID=683042 RepID=A0A7G9S3H0_9MICO|nr:bifunctional phosphopantothenoylcysteine decarboxylase/phosphopantothenate--cysteine ligase CoaBC [Leucobacter denitrificans]QNN62395.1 bifunctional phosphopantothenoylcysteine decarboxylase/phosphopantothenate--cysteine ligase CoaBC [Leucobacter denitrificans]
MNIVLGVTGGIAAYKAVSLARLLVLAGHELHVVPTADALRFVGLPTWEAISRNPVTTSVHDDVPEVRHVRLGQQADLVIVAPATANTIARMATGIADDLLGTTLLATQATVLVAPAMHTEMWEHPATQANVQVLRERGIEFIGPESGQLTGADSGPGRMSEPEAIAEAVDRILTESDLETPAPDLEGIRVLVSAGGTREPIDPVRYIGNRSSGRQGVALAAAAAARGADVVLVSANIEQSVLDDAIHPRVRIEPVGTATEMQGVVEREVASADIVIMAAAVSDYRVAKVADGKLRKENSRGKGMSIALTENPDILAGLVQEHRRSGLTIVGFAAETVASEEELVERGKRKRARKGVDLLAVNAVGWNEGFEAGDNSLIFIDASDSVTGAVQGSKREVADALLTEVLRARGNEPL